MTEHAPRFPFWADLERRPRRRPAPWRSLVRLAEGKKQWRQNPGAFDGWVNQQGVVYIRCAFHREKTPSLAIYPRRPGARCGPEAPHFHCYGCHAHGSIRRLAKELRSKTAAGAYPMTPPPDWEMPACYPDNDADTPF